MPPLLQMLRFAQRATGVLLLMVLAQPPVAHGGGNTAKPGMQGDMKHMGMSGMDRRNMDMKGMNKGEMNMDGMMGGENANGRRIAERVCAGCHGVRGASPSDDYPNLAGQDHMYIMSSLMAYRDGSRTATPMNGVAAKLSDQDIHDVAMYYMGCGPAE